MPMIDKALFEPCDNADVKIYSVGIENQPLIRIANCMRGVDRLRDYAIYESKNFSASDSYYPGIRFPVPIIYAMAVVKFYGKELSRVFDLDFRRLSKVRSVYSIVTFQPDKLKFLQQIPHFDAPSKNSLAMVHYLIDSPECGTGFFRHKKSRYEYIDETRYEYYMRSVQSQFPEPGVYSRGYICGDTPEYELIEIFEAVCNSIIIYRGSSLHSGLISPGYTFDPSPRTGRLTITTFFEFT